MCYKIRNVNDLNVKTQTTKRASFVNYIIEALRRTASMAHAQYGHHFAVTAAPVYVRMESRIIRQLTAYKKT